MAPPKKVKAETYEGFIRRDDRKYTSIEKTTDEELTNTLIFEFYMRCDDFLKVYDEAKQRIKSLNKITTLYELNINEEEKFDLGLGSGLFEKFGFYSNEIENYIDNEIKIEEELNSLKSKVAIQKFIEIQTDIDAILPLCKKLNFELENLNNIPVLYEYEKIEIDLEKEKLNKKLSFNINKIKQLRSDQNDLLLLIHSDYISHKLDDPLLNNGLEIFIPYINDDWGKNNDHLVIDVTDKILENESFEYIDHCSEMASAIANKSKNPKIKSISTVRYKYSKPRYRMDNSYEFAISINLLTNKEELRRQLDTVLDALETKYVQDKKRKFDIDYLQGKKNYKIIDDIKTETYKANKQNPQARFANMFYFYDMKKLKIPTSSISDSLKELEKENKELKIKYDIDTINNGASYIEKFLLEKKFLQFIKDLKEIDE